MQLVGQFPEAVVPGTTGEAPPRDAGPPTPHPSPPSEGAGGELAPRPLGSSGITVFPLGVGCWVIGGEDVNLGLHMGWGTAEDGASLRGLARAFELGPSLSDTADIYGHGHAERLLGRFLRGVPRDQVVITSKVGYFAGTAPNAFHPLHMRHQLEQTLDNLGTGYLDIYFFHNFHFGPEDLYLTDAIEQMRGFREQGLVRAVGMRGPIGLRWRSTQRASLAELWLERVVGDGVGEATTRGTWL